MFKSENFVHLQRNIRKYMTKADVAEFNKELDKIKFAFSFDEAVQKFYDLCSKFKGKYSRYMNLLMEKAEHYMAFTKYTKSLRKYIYTTNSVESINSLVEKIRIRSGGYFNFVEVLELTYIYRGRT